MPQLTYTVREARRLLGPEFDQLIETGDLRPAATNREGRPLYSAEDLRRAAPWLTFIASARPRRPSREPA